MRGDLTPYLETRDSGIRWLGEVPEHWKIVPNRAVYREIKERDCPAETMLSVTIKQGVVHQETLLSTSGAYIPKSTDRKPRER